MAFTSPPTAPSRTQDSDTFNSNADAFISWFATHVSELNGFLSTNTINYNATSSSSVAVGTGSKSFTVETGKLLQVGQWVIVASSASPTNYMIGQVTAYNSGTGALTVNVSYTSGSGTIASWIVALVAAPNTNVNPRAITAGATTGTITPDSANADEYIVIGATGGLTFAAPSGTPVQGQKLMLRFKDNGTSRALTWNAIYKPYGTVSLPSATTIGKTHYVGMIYNATDSTWNVISHVVEQ
jgi:hypothetical protein